MGLSGAMWGLVQPGVAAVTTTVVYDRAGSGSSDDDAEPRTLERIVGDLSGLLRTLDGPFVLVGSSWGGPIIRKLAASGEFPVKGLVLVDQSDENADEYFTPAGERRMEQTERFAMFLARSGVYRLASRVGRRLPADVYADFKKDFSTRGARVMRAEVAEFLPAMRHLRDNPVDLEGVDVTVISGTKPNFVERSQRPAINRAHRTTADTLKRGRYVEASRSGHYIMFTEPGIVVDEIRRLVD